MRAEEAAPATGLVDRYHLCFALGKALEDRGEYAESWRYYERGNALKRAESRYRPEIIETNTRLQIEVCTREFFAQRTRLGATERRADLHRRPAALRARRCWSRSWPRIRRSRARRNCRTSRASCSSCRDASPISTTRATRRVLARDGGRGFPPPGRDDTWPIPASTAPASRFSSTRCRTTSGTSA